MVVISQVTTHMFSRSRKKDLSGIDLFTLQFYKQRTIKVSSITVEI